MNTRPRIAALAAAAAAALSLSTGAIAQQAQAAADSMQRAPDPMALQQPTRESVRADLEALKEAGALTPDGEVGDTRRTLMARERYSEAVGDELRAEYERQAAVDAAAAAEPAPSMAPPGAQDGSVAPSTQRQ